MRNFLWRMLVVLVVVLPGVVMGQPGPVPPGSSGSLTPWTSDINGAGKKLTNAVIDSTVVGNGAGLSNLFSGTVQGTNGNGRAVLTIGNSATATIGILKLYDGAQDKQQSITAADAEMDFSTGISPGDYYFDALGAGKLHANGASLTALNASALASGNLQGNTLDANTNTWAINSNFPLGTTNGILVSGAATGGITGLGNKSTSTDRAGVIKILATGDIVFTNPASFKTSDFLTSRTITNGNSAIIQVDFTPGQFTNMAIAQYK